MYVQIYSEHLTYSVFINAEMPVPDGTRRVSLLPQQVHGVRRHGKHDVLLCGHCCTQTAGLHPPPAIKGRQSCLRQQRQSYQVDRRCFLLAHKLNFDLE